MENQHVKILITICARGGSKGVPRKNVREIEGKPLIAYSIDAAKTFAERHDADMILSTEDPEIRTAAARYGLETDYRRPEALADDKTGKVAVIRDVWAYAEAHHQCQYDLVLDLDVSSPLRTQQDLDEALILFQNKPEALTLFSVNPAHRNPYFNMVEETEEGLVTIAKKPENLILSRQTAPNVYDINGSFYYYRRQFFLEGHEGVIQDHRSMVYVMNHLCFDVDNEIDWLFMKMVIEGNHLDFELS